MGIGLVLDVVHEAAETDRTYEKEEGEETEFFLGVSDNLYNNDQILGMFDEFKDSDNPEDPADPEDSYVAHGLVIRVPTWRVSLHRMRDNAHIKRQDGEDVENVKEIFPEGQQAGPSTESYQQIGSKEGNYKGVKIVEIVVSWM